MALRCQAGTVDEVRILHAQLPGAVVHLLHKQLRDPRHMLGQRYRRVVAGGNAHRLQQIVHRDLLALRKIHLTAAHSRSIGADRYHIVHRDAAVGDGLHGQQHRHDLGDAGRRHGVMFVLGVEDLARRLFHQQRRMGGQRQLHAPTGHHHTPHQHYRRQKNHRSFHMQPSFFCCHDMPRRCGLCVARRAWRGFPGSRRFSPCKARKSVV